jgi:hypothetical protein
VVVVPQALKASSETVAAIAKVFMFHLLEC